MDKKAPSVIKILICALNNAVFFDKLAYRLHLNEIKPKKHSLLTANPYFCIVI